MDRRQLTPHFQRWEFTASEIAARADIENEPDASQWENLEALAATVLEPCRAALGPLRVSSGFRSPVVNVLVGGARHSQHLSGEAVDIVAYDCTLEDLFKWLYESEAPWDQLIWEFSRWVHVSHVRDGSQRRQALVATKVDGKTVYAPITATWLANL